MKTEGILTEVITALALAMDLEEDVKLYHAWRVAILGQEMADILDPTIKGQVFFAGLLHDLGGIGLPDHVVHYPTLEEQKTNPQIVGHSYHGAHMIANLPGLTLAPKFIQDHHERWDGQGYPKGKKGQEISLGGQILRLADSFDLWIRANPALNRKDVVAIAAKYVGGEYSQQVFDAFQQAVSKGVFYHRLIRENSLAFYLKQLEQLYAKDFKTITYSMEQVLTVFAQVIDAKHQYTKGHSERVSQYAHGLAIQMGLSLEQQKMAKWAGLLHDAGKLAVPRRVLDKPGKLEGDEIKIIRLHPILTMEILGMITAFEELAPAAGYHHERYDGRGYPDGLKGEEIPLLARIMAVADAFDAMTSGRSYQKTKTPAEALMVIKKNSGSQFDPQVVTAAEEILHNTTLT